MSRWMLLLALFFCSGRAAENIAEWQATKWNGERAVVAASSGWKAIVSIERARLVHFGRADNEDNLLFAPATKRDPAGWGGHRLWLGPQSTWSGGWPPPAAWEQSGAVSFSQADGILRLIMPEAGNGWPRMIRTYRWNGDRLTCSAELSGGSRNVQVIQIIQIPSVAVVKATASPDKNAPVGYVILPSTATPQLVTDFNPPPHVTRDGNGLALRHLKKVQKLGFAPQTLAAHEKIFVLKMSRLIPVDVSVSEPDRGFFTQVYLGGPESFIELEQLSPLFPAGQKVSFAIEIQGVAP